jgi:hypothetical protein
MKTTWFEDENGEWRWHTQADNNEIVATSGEGYENHQDAISGWYVSEGGQVASLPGLPPQYSGGPDMLQLVQHVNADQTEIESYSLEW